MRSIWLLFHGVAARGLRPASAARTPSVGQSLVEFALIATVFLLLLMGIIDLGRGVMAQNSLSHAAREGAHVGLFMEKGKADIITAVNRQVGLGANLDNFGMEVVYMGKGGELDKKEPGSTVTVTVTGDFRAVTPMMNAAIDAVAGSGKGLRLSATAQSIVQ